MAFAEVDILISYSEAINNKRKILSHKWAKDTDSDRGWRGNSVSRGTGATSSQQDRAWEIAKGLRPAPQQKGMAKAA